MDTISPSTLRDEFAMRAPVELLMVHAVWGDGEVNLSDTTTRRAFLAVWAMLCYEWADAILEQRAEPTREPGQPLPSAPAPTPAETEDRRLDRLLISLDWWDYRVIVPLKKAGVETLRELLALDVYRLDAIKGVGPDGFRDVLDRLNREGLMLKPKPNTPPPGASDSDAVGEEVLGS
jgi:hypothetical protein